MGPRALGFINRVAPGLFQGVSLLCMSDAISGEEVNFAVKRFWAACVWCSLWLGAGCRCDCHSSCSQKVRVRPGPGSRL